MTDNLQNDKQVDNLTGSQAATPPPAATGDNKQPEPTFTQAQLNAIITDRLNRDREARQAEFLQSLGVSSLDDAKTALEAKRKADDAAMSEVEKAQLEAQKAQDALKAEQEKNAALLKQMLDSKRDNGLLAHLTTAHDAKKVLALLKVEKPDAIQALLNDEGVFNEEQAKQLIADYQKENGYLFKSSNPGSQSNSDGKPPQPDKKVVEEVAKEIHSKFGKL